MPQHREAVLRIGGVVPLTTIDYPDHLSCVVFCQGCAWRCRYCHNPDLIPSRTESKHRWEDIVAFLQRRQGLLDAVVFSGGEATLQPALAKAMAQVRTLGFKVGLHTAGIKPEALARVLPLCDWVGFDIKGLPEQCNRITGKPASGINNWRSLKILLASHTPYECRITVHWHLMTASHVLQLAGMLKDYGVQQLAVQCARTERTLQTDLPRGTPPADPASLWEKIRQLFPDFILRD